MAPGLDETTILLIEADASAASGVVHAFQSAGGRVWHAETAADARAILRQHRPDLIVLDLRLPDLDGLVLYTWLRAEAPGVPIVLCGAQTGRDTVLGFQLGADDVMAGPPAVPELEARVRAVLARRQRQSPTEPGQADGAVGGPASDRPLGSLHMDVAHSRVMLDGRRLELTPTEFQLLRYLAERAGRIVSRDELARSVWGDRSMSGSRTIDAYVRRLRAKLQGAEAPEIMSVRGFGYVLTTEIVSAA